MYDHVSMKPKRFFFVFENIFAGISLENPHETSIAHLENRWA